MFKSPEFSRILFFLYESLIMSRDFLFLSFLTKNYMEQFERMKMKLYWALHGHLHPHVLILYCGRVEQEYSVEFWILDWM